MMFDWEQLSAREREIARAEIGVLRQPDLTIAPDGKPYLYRWHITKTDMACVYFHIQVADDPERPLHDHPWDNTSVILLGGYVEILSTSAPPTPSSTHRHRRLSEDVIHRQAEWSHRLLILPEYKFTMTRFSTGRKQREWGFWYPDGWRPFSEVTQLSTDGKTSVHVRDGVPSSA